MRFLCEKCRTKYAIADDKVRDKIVKVRCKTCGNVIVLRRNSASSLPAVDEDSRAVASNAASAASAAAGVAPSTGGRPKLTAITGGAGKFLDDEDCVTTAYRPKDEREDDWYLAVDGQQYGPMNMAELCSRVKRGEARDTDGEEGFVWRDGFDDWIEVGQVAELRPYLPPPPPPRNRGGQSTLALVESDAEAPRGAPGPIDATAHTEGLLVAAAEAGAGAPKRPPSVVTEAALGKAIRMSWTVKLALLLGLVGAASGIALLIYFLFIAPPVSTKEVVRVVTVESDAHTTTKTPPELSETPEEAAPQQPVAPQTKRRKVKRRPRPSVAETTRQAPRKPLTAEEKRLLALYDQGEARIVDDVARTKKQAGPGREISSTEIAAVYRQHRRTLEACYNRALKRDPELADRKAMVKLLVGASGVVKRVTIRTKNKMLTECLKANIERWVFKPLDSEASISFPVIFAGQ